MFDVSLYANNEDNALFAILPKYTLGAKTKNTTIYSPTHLRVDGIVEKNTTLSAGGNVLLGNGFKVKQGFTLKISIGVHQ